MAALWKPDGPTGRRHVTVIRPGGKGAQTLPYDTLAKLELPAPPKPKSVFARPVEVLAPLLERAELRWLFGIGIITAYCLLRMAI